MRLHLLCLLSPALVLLSGAALARSEEQHQYLGQTTGAMVAAWAALPQTLGKNQLSEEQIKALTPVLMNKDKEEPEDVFSIASLLVFQRNRIPTYVATSWKTNHFTVVVTVDRVTQNNGLQRVLTLKNAHYKITQPSGQDVFPDHVPALFVDEASGGSWYGGDTQHLYRLDKEVVEVTPPLRTPWIEQREGALMRHVLR